MEKPWTAGRKRLAISALLAAIAAGLHEAASNRDNFPVNLGESVAAHSVAILLAAAAAFFALRGLRRWLASVSVLLIGGALLYHFAHRRYLADLPPPPPTITIKTLDLLRLGSSEKPIQNTDRFRDHKVTIANLSSKPLVHFRFRFQLPGTVIKTMPDEAGDPPLHISLETDNLEYAATGGASVNIEPVIGAGSFIVSGDSFPANTSTTFWFRVLRTMEGTPSDVLDRLLPGQLMSYVDGKYGESDHANRFVVPIRMNFQYELTAGRVFLGPKFPTMIFSHDTVHGRPIEPTANP